MTRRARTLTALVVAMAVVVPAGITAMVLTRDRGPEGANVSPGRQNSVTSADGLVTVDIPGDAVDSPGILTITPVPGTSAAWDIDLEGAQLVGEAEIRFSADTSDSDVPTPSVLFQEDQQTQRAAEDVQRGDGEVVVRTTHFSRWWVIDWEGMRRSIVDAISQSVSISEDRAPTCEGEAQAREQYDVASDDGRRVYWCLGVEDGKTVLKAVNGRQYGVSAESTPGLRQAHLDNTDVVGHLAELLTPPPSLSANTVNLLPSGDAIEFEITGEEPRVGLMIKPDPGAYLLSALMFGIETYSMVLSRGGQDVAEKRLGIALSGASCLNDLTGMMTTDLASAEEAQEFFAKALDASFSCVGVAAEDMDLGWVLEGWVKPMVWLVSGVKTAIMGLVAVGDIVLDVDGYQIIVTDRTGSGTASPGDLTAFEGTWSGPVDQPGVAPYTTLLTIETGDATDLVGAVVGSVRYPELGNCSGTLTLAAVEGQTLSVTESITANAARCVRRVDLTLTLGPDGTTLLYAAPGYGSEGVLRR